MGLYFSWCFMLINLAKQAKDTKKKHITFFIGLCYITYICKLSMILNVSFLCYSEMVAEIRNNGLIILFIDSEHLKSQG